MTLSGNAPHTAQMNYYWVISVLSCGPLSRPLHDRYHHLSMVDQKQKGCISHHSTNNAPHTHILRRSARIWSAMNYIFAKYMMNQSKRVLVRSAHPSIQFNNSWLDLKSESCLFRVRLSPIRIIAGIRGGWRFACGGWSLTANWHIHGPIFSSSFSLRPGFQIHIVHSTYNP